MKILLNCDENFTQIYYGFYSNLLANLLNSPIYTNRIALKFRQLIISFNRFVILCFLLNQDCLMP